VTELLQRAFTGFIYVSGILVAIVRSVGADVQMTAAPHVASPIQ
jgi:hypothetical protein